MRVPQVTDRLKEAPAQALRAVFSGVGQVLLVADRLRHRPGQDDSRPAPAPPTPGTPGTLDGPPVEQPAPPAPTAPFTPSAAPPSGDSGAPGSSDCAADGGGLPLAGYDGLTVPQLRARMRNLDPAQLRALVAYERAHGGRDDVVAMFERRIVKVESGE